jgi:para-aminobenzoate synthetase/4-amino-4-deoxychorismate lyase
MASPPAAEFSLLETMRLEDGRLVRETGHLARMGAAAERCGFAWDQRRVTRALAEVAGAHPAGRWRVRLLLSPSGEPTAECTVMPQPSERPWRIGFAAHAIDEGDPFLRIKTTRRVVYEAARAARPDLDDVLLWTAAGEVTESTIANLVAQVDGVLCTPPATLPLLPGVFRSQLLTSGRVVERVLLRQDVARSPHVWLVNSLREWIDIQLDPDPN